MFTISTRAEKTALTTLAAVKLNLGITDGKDDAWLQTQIDSASMVICNYLGVEMADDGTRTLGQETLVETLDRRSRYPWLPPFGIVVPRREADARITLARRPVRGIASIAENGTALDPADFELEATTGIVRRLSSALVAAWPCTLIVVTYTAGWLLPGQDNRNLPPDIEQAAIGLVQASWFARKRDPNVKSENIFGIRQVDYFFGTPGQGAGPLPVDVMAKLGPYRNMSL
jgi:hypothetical protein